MGIIENQIKKRLSNYRIQVNHINDSLPSKIESEKNIAVVGAGIAGLTASILLAEKGFKVKLFERDNFLGGKVGSWKVKLNNEFETRVEHGFHAFFRQYYNLRGILKKIDTFKNLIPIDDYLIMTKEHGNFSFKDINKTPLLNILSMRKSGVYSILDPIKNRKFSRMTDLFKYDMAKTFKEYDNISFKEFADDINLPPEMRLMFTTFSRAFFALPEFISMAELIKSFHFYFLSNDQGLIYDVLNDDFHSTLLTPAKEFIENHGGSIVVDSPVLSIKKSDSKFEVNNELFDYLVMATDIHGTKKIFSNSDFIKYGETDFYNQIMNQKKSQKYTVLRLWMDKRIGDDLPFFIFTDALKILDSVTFYHCMEKESAEWAKNNNGGIYELHSYAIPDEFDDDLVYSQILEEFYTYFPEMKSSNILYHNLQIKKDFTAFHTGLDANRPGPITRIENLYLSGDWIKLPIPAMLMEASASSAIYAVNDICKKENIREEPIMSVPLKGLLA